MYAQFVAREAARAQVKAAVLHLLHLEMLDSAEPINGISLRSEMDADGDLETDLTFWQADLAVSGESL